MGLRGRGRPSADPQRKGEEQRGTAAPIRRRASASPRRPRGPSTRTREALGVREDGLSPTARCRLLLFSSWSLSSSRWGRRGVAEGRPLWFPRRQEATSLKQTGEQVTGEAPPSAATADRQGPPSLATEGTSKRPGLWVLVSFWSPVRHRRAHHRSPGDTGQGFDPIREEPAEVAFDGRAAGRSRRRLRKQNKRCRLIRMRRGRGPSPSESQSAAMCSRGR